MLGSRTHLRPLAHVTRYTNFRPVFTILLTR